MLVHTRMDPWNCHLEFPQPENCAKGWFELSALGMPQMIKQNLLLPSGTQGVVGEAPRNVQS